MIHLALFLPLVAGVVLMLAPGLGRALALVASGATFVLSLALLVRYPGEGLAYNFQTPLLEPAGVYYAVGLDGASLFLWLAVSLVVLLAVWLCRVPGRFLALALMMETGLLGIFAATDLVLFYVFFEATLIPSLVMLGLFGGKERMKALYTFALFTLAGSLPMLASVLAVRYLGGSPSFLLSDLLAHPLEGSAVGLVFLGFALAFTVKTPLFPLHAWLPSFHAENHSSGLADAMGTLYKVGVFAFFRWAMPLLPQGFAELQGLLLLLAAFTALYGAWVAFAAKDWKRLLAYGGVSHMGLAALGLFSGTQEGMVGALFLLAASMVYTSGLFLFAGMVGERTGGLELNRVGGLAKSAPALSVLGLFLVMAMVGLPGLSGFPGEFLALLGAYKASPWLTLLGFSAVIAAAAYALTAYQSVFHQHETRAARDLEAREQVFAASMVASMLLLGLYPRLFTELLEPAAKQLVLLLGGGS
ncbi:MAG: NADH-quinone oxidoreductase subunit M [Deinococcus sp.]|nr:NADH-quinone oxidoreductase subunit M [Deinococcus sp.]